MIHEKPMHAQEVTVWCAVWSESVIMPYFFENDVGQTETIKGERQSRVITDDFWYAIEDIDVDNLFQKRKRTTALV